MLIFYTTAYKAVMMLLVLTQDFDRDEAILVAIMNSIRVAEEE